MVIDTMFVYHFVYRNLRVEILFEKERATDRGGFDFEIGHYVPLHTCIGLQRKFHEELVCFFIVF